MKVRDNADETLLLVEKQETLQFPPTQRTLILEWDLFLHSFSHILTLQQCIVMFLCIEDQVSDIGLTAPKEDTVCINILLPFCHPIKWKHKLKNACRQCQQMQHVNDVQDSLVIVTKLFLAIYILGIVNLTAVSCEEMEKSIARLETARQKREGGGFLVRRPVGDKIDFSACDPFLMLDHMGPADYGPGEALGAPDHPHRGFETVTYIIEGGMTHKDSAGNSGNLLPGWVQWMTAGSGVVHSEMPTEELLKNGGRMEGFQLWVNLPKKDKMIAPRYQDTAAEKIPVVKSDDGKTTVKVIAGESLGTKAVIETRSPILYLDIHVSPGGSFTQKIPHDFNCFVYTWRGSGFIGDTAVQMGQVALLSKNGDQVTIKAGQKDSIHVLLIGGIPLNEPIAHYGPFVMNTWEEIDEAIRDYRKGKLGQIAGAEERYEKTRSAVQQQKTAGTWRDSL